MKTEYKSLFSIAHDHFHGLMVAEMIKEGSENIAGLPSTPEAKARYTIHFYNQELENHFYIEEHILQPAVTGISIEIDEIFKEIVKDHHEIEEKVDALKDEKDLVRKLDSLGKSIEAHVQKEERVLFPKIQEILSEEELETLAGKLSANGYEYIYKY